MVDWQTDQRTSLLLSMQSLPSQCSLLSLRHHAVSFLLLFQGYDQPRPAPRSSTPHRQSQLFVGCFFVPCHVPHLLQMQSVVHQTLAFQCTSGILRLLSSEYRISFARKNSCSQHWTQQSRQRLLLKCSFPLQHHQQMFSGLLTW